MTTRKDWLTLLRCRSMIGWAPAIAIVLVGLQLISVDVRRFAHELPKPKADKIVRQQILAASEHMPPPFDTLLSDEDSPLFAKVLKYWNETMELVNAKVDVFTPLILGGVGSKHQVLAFAYAVWRNLNITAAGAAPIRNEFSPHEYFLNLLEREKDNATMLPTVFSGHYDTNWGWLSTTFPNVRTCNWGYVSRDPRWKDLITDNPNVIAVFSVQHHNFSDPALDNKMLSLPLGGVLSREVWDRLQTRPPGLLRDSDYDLTLAGRAYSFRVEIFCHLINSHQFPCPPRDLVKTTESDFLHALSINRYIWTPPGLGYDCHKNWDVLLSGAIPIMERGFGLERTYSYLPSFWIDSYYNLTSEKLENAYPVFVALRNEFDFTRLGIDYWKKLLRGVASEKNDESLRIQHPFAKQRVIWPRIDKGPPIGLLEGAFQYCNLTNNTARTFEMS